MLKTRIENRYWLAATWFAFMRAGARNASRLAILAACWAGLQSIAHAGTINVNSTAQHSSGRSFECTLGAAILAANHNEDLDGCVIVGTPTPPYTINVPSGTYTLSNPDSGTFGLPAITTQVTLQGANSDQTIIERANVQGTANFGILSVDSGINLVTIHGLTFQNGKNDGRGGAITVQSGQLFVTNSVFQFNSSGADGGAISGSNSITIDIIDSTFTSNSAATQGGAVTGYLTVSGSTFNSNTARDGGAIVCPNLATCWVQNSDFSQNVATGNGGAVASAVVRIEQSTFVSNASPAGDGGAIFTTDGPSNIAHDFFDSNTSNSKGGAIFCTNCLLTGSTFKSNSSSSGGAFYGDFSTLINNTFYSNSAGSGGAIYSRGENLFNNLTVVRNSSTGSGGGIAFENDNMQNSIVALNTGVGESPDCIVNTPGTAAPLASLAISRGHNLVGVGCNIGAMAGDQFGTAESPIDPVLGSPSANNGLKIGRNGQVDVPTLAVLVGSPALDAGNLATPGSGLTACAGTDQREVTRPVGSACDIGAFEAKAGGETVSFDVSVTSTPSAAQVTVGSALSYAISVDNHLSSNTASGLTLTDDISPSKFLQITSAAGWNCTTPAVGTSGTIACTKASLAAQQSDTISIGVQAPFSAGDLLNTVNLATTGDDTDLTNNQATTHVTVLAQDADLALAMSGSPASVQVGNNVTYTATVTNQGPGTATAVDISGAIPGQATFVSAQVTSPIPAPCNVVSNVLHCPVGSLPPGTPASITVVMSPLASAVPALTFQLNAVANEHDPNSTNNVATVTTSVTPAPRPDFSFTISTPTATISQGGKVQVAVTLTPSGGFSGPVQVTCSGAPEATCSSVPSPVMLGNGNPVQASVMIQTTAPSIRAAFTSPWDGTQIGSRPSSLAALGGLMALTLPLLLVGWRSPRSRVRMAGCASFVLMLLLACAGCGGIRSPAADNGTPKGSYTVTITAISGQTSHSSTMTVIVGP